MRTNSPRPALKKTRFQAIESTHRILRRHAKEKAQHVIAKEPQATAAISTVTLGLSQQPHLIRLTKPVPTQDVEPLHSLSASK
jgi:hypothetical protein